MCEASSLHPYREAKVGDIAKLGTVPNANGMRGLFEDGKQITSHIDHYVKDMHARLVCARQGATLFIEKMNLIARLGNSEFFGAENIECTFAEHGREWAVGDGFVMRNGVLIPLTEVLDGTRVRFGMAFA